MHTYQPTVADQEAAYLSMKWNSEGNFVSVVTFQCIILFHSAVKSFGVPGTGLSGSWLQPARILGITSGKAVTKIVTVGFWEWFWFDSLKLHVEVTSFTYSLTLLLTYLLTYPMEQSHSWDVKPVFSKWRNSTHLMESESTLPHSQVTVTEDLLNIS